MSLADADDAPSATMAPAMAADTANLVILRMRKNPLWEQWDESGRTLAARTRRRYGGSDEQREHEHRAGDLRVADDRAVRDVEHAVVPARLADRHRLGAGGPARDGQRRHHRRRAGGR